MVDLLVQKEWNRRIVDVSSSGGSCQFESIGHQLCLSHLIVRQKAVEYIETNLERYDGLLIPTPESYLNKMAQQTTWGDHLTLDAIANVFNVTIQVAAAFEDPAIITVEPVKPSTTVIFVGLYPESHYVSTVLI